MTMFTTFLILLVISLATAMPADMAELEQLKKSNSTDLKYGACKITQYVLALQVRKLSFNQPCSCIIDFFTFSQHSCGTETIHGLWPDPQVLLVIIFVIDVRSIITSHHFFSKASCDTCSSEVFSESKLSSSTLSDMKKYWPTCESGTNDSFWSHEWSKHGTCTGMTQDAYFAKGISLYKAYGATRTSAVNLCFSPTFAYQGVC